MEQTCNDSGRHARRISLTIGVLLILGIAVFKYFPVGIFAGILDIRSTQVLLQKKEVYEPVGRCLATFCQSDQSLFPKYLSYVWLPSELAKIRHGRGRISTNFASIELGGGFYHYGYKLLLDSAASTGSTNVWKLYLYREGQQSDTHLMSLALSSAHHMTRDELANLVVVGFDDSIQAGDTTAYQGKILNQLRFGKLSEAAASSRAWIKAEPAGWLPQLTYAHIRCRQDEFDLAAKEFSKWVQQNQNFAHCIYLALFYFREGKINASLPPLQLALKQPFIEAKGTSGSKFFLGYNGALIAYANGDIDLCRSLCDKMLADPRQEDHWRRKILCIAAAATFVREKEPPALAILDRAIVTPERGSLSESTAKRAASLRNAIQANDIKWIRDYHNLADTYDKWFSPFETDETGLHGDGLNLPTPFPGSWKTDRISAAPEE